MAIKSHALWKITKPNGKVLYGKLRYDLRGKKHAKFLLFRIVPKPKKTSP
jgi:hypothetical protein